jgi:hypothetical protein
MARIDTPAPASASPPPDGGEPRRQDVPYRWRTFALWLAGLLLLLGVLFGLRTFQIFPGPASEDAEIVTARATQAAFLTREAASAKTPPVAATVPAAAPPLEHPQPTPAAAAATAITAVASGQQPASVQTPSQQIVAAPASTSAPPAQTSPTPIQAVIPADLAGAILQGYSDYWSVRVLSLRTPDPANQELDRVMTGFELARAQEVLAGYQRDGKAYQSDIKHQIWITQATTSEAVVVDEYIATSVRLDPATMEPVNADASPNVEHLRTTFLLQNIGGRWKVADEREGG